LTARIGAVESAKAMKLTIEITREEARSLRAIGKRDGLKKIGRPFTTEETAAEAIRHHIRDRGGIAIRGLLR
jgi:hypothetical protein